MQEIDRPFSNSMLQMMHGRTHLAARRILAILLLLGACKAGRDAHAAANSSRSDGPPAWLVERGAEEQRLAATSAAFHDFRFTDRVAESGITFVNRVVDDAG